MQPNHRKKSNHLNPKCDYTLDNNIPLKGGVHFRLSEYAQAVCDRLGISEKVIRDVIENGTRTEICDGLATCYCFCLEDLYYDPRWTGLTVVVSNQTDTIVSVFFLQQ